MAAAAFGTVNSCFIIFTVPPTRGKVDKPVTRLVVYFMFPKKPLHKKMLIFSGILYFHKFYKSWFSKTFLIGSTWVIPGYYSRLRNNSMEVFAKEINFPLFIVDCLLPFIGYAIDGETV